MSTSQIPGAQRISSSSQNSIGHSTETNDLQLSVLEKSCLAFCTSTTPMRKTNGGTRKGTVFSLTHMHTVSFQEAGERKTASVGQGIKYFPIFPIKICYVTYHDLCLLLLHPLHHTTVSVMLKSSEQTKVSYW